MSLRRLLAPWRLLASEVLSGLREDPLVQKERKDHFMGKP